MQDSNQNMLAVSMSNGFMLTHGAAINKVHIGHRAEQLGLDNQGW